MAVYGIAWVIFAVGKSTDNSTKLGPDDSSKFRVGPLLPVECNIDF